MGEGLASLAQLNITSTAMVRTDVEMVNSNITDTMAVIKPMATNTQDILAQLTKITASVNRLVCSLSHEILAVFKS